MCMPFFDEVERIFEQVADRDNLRVSCLVLGGNQAHIEGVAKIVTLGDEAITVLLKKGHISITGEGLRVVRCERDNLSVQGRIKGISFE